MPARRRSTFRSPSRRRSAWRAVSATLLAVVAVLGGLTACEPPPKTTLGIFLPFQTCCVGGPEIIREARALGVRTVRFSQNVTQPVRATFGVFERNGMRVVLSAINDPQPDGLGHNPGRPPEDLARYRQHLGAVLDGMADPVLVQIENEENARNFYVGTMAEYVEQLDVAIEVAHERGLKITNGGITNKPLQLLVWQDYRDRGLEARQLMRTAIGHRLFPLYWLTAMTGMRRNEVVGLKWPQHRRHQEASAPQPWARRRRLRGPPDPWQDQDCTADHRADDTTLAVLAGWRAHQAAEFAAVGITNDEGWVFTNGDGKPVHPHAVYEAFRRIVRNAGVPTIRYHDLRVRHEASCIRAG